VGQQRQLQQLLQVGAEPVGRLPATIAEPAALRRFLLPLSYMFILLRAIHQMFINEAAYAE
jgi:hypothetical protein